MPCCSKNFNRSPTTQTEAEAIQAIRRSLTSIRTSDYTAVATASPRNAFSYARMMSFSSDSFKHEGIASGLKLKNLVLIPQLALSPVR